MWFRNVLVRGNQRWNSADVFLRNSVFTAVQSLIKAVQSFSSNAQRWIRIGTFLKLSQHTCKACTQEVQRRTIPDPQGNWWIVKRNSNFYISCFSYFSCDPYVSYTDHPGELIQTNTEPLRNKWIFTAISVLRGAIFVVFHSFYLIYIYFLSVIKLI